MEQQRILQQLLTENVKNDTTLMMTDGQCKTDLRIQTLLFPPIPGAKFLLYTNASDHAVGAVLHQVASH